MVELLSRKQKTKKTPFNMLAIQKMSAEEVVGGVIALIIFVAYDAIVFKAAQG